jgi:hypothetical protein
VDKRQTAPRAVLFRQLSVLKLLDITNIHTVLCLDLTKNTSLSDTEHVCPHLLSCNLDFATTPVTLASVNARSSGETTRLSWSTATETGNVGFHVYVETAKGWLRYTDEPIPSQAVDSTQPLYYTLDLPFAV